jgi:hypothetical protein
VPHFIDRIGDVVGDVICGNVQNSPSIADGFASGVYAIYDILDFDSLVFSGADVVTVRNQASPGTRDLDCSAAPPLYVAAGLDGQPCLRFDGVTERAFSLGWDIPAGSRPSVHLVAQAQSVATRGFWGFLGGAGTTEEGNGYIQSGGPATWRAYDGASLIGSSGTATNGVPVLLQYGWPASGAYARKNLGAKVETALTTGTTAGGINRFHLGHNAPAAIPCAVDVSICIVAEASADPEAAALAYGYVATHYPTIAAALP